MNTYLAFKVPVCKNAKWYNWLLDELESVDVRWQHGHYHITLAYLDETPEGVDIGSVISTKVVGMAAPSLIAQRKRRATRQVKHRRR